MAKTIKVMIVDDHQLLIDTLKSYLKYSDEIEVIAEAHNGQEALEKLEKLVPAEGTPMVDIVLMDITMPVMGGKEATQAIVDKYNDKLDVLMMTMEDSGKVVAEMLDVGASGYALKDDGAAQLEKAILAVYKKGLYYGPSVKEAYFAHMASKPPKTEEKPLTKSESNIVQEIVDGFINKEIAERNYVAVGTVETHIRNIMKKLKARNRAEVVREAIKHGLVEI